MASRKIRKSSTYFAFTSTWKIPNVFPRHRRNSPASKSAKRIGVAKLAPHDLRRTCARLCHASGGELEQVQFLLGHVSVQTTERYLRLDANAIIDD
jgi:integrase